MNSVQQLIMVMSIKLQCHPCDQPRGGWRKPLWQLSALLRTITNTEVKQKPILQPCGKTTFQLFTNIDWTRPKHGKSEGIYASLSLEGTLKENHQGA